MRITVGYSPAHLRQKDQCVRIDVPSTTTYTTHSMTLTGAHRAPSHTSRSKVCLIIFRGVCLVCTHKYTQEWTESAWMIVKIENTETRKKKHKTTNTSTRKSTSRCWHTDTMSSPSSCLSRGGSHTHKAVCAKSLQSKSPVNHLSRYAAN